MRKSKIRIGVLVIVLLLLLLVSCQCNEGVKPTEEPIPTEYLITTQSPEPVASETELPAEETDIPMPTIAATPSVLETESKTPEPEPEKIKSSQSEMFCTMAVHCDDILQNMDKLKSGKEKFIPDDGVILLKQEVVFSSGETVFDVLYRVVKEKGIHIEFVNTPMYNSVYIEGIANLYEFDCGRNSGWIYTVNGESPMHGCSQHIISQGDNIEFIYKCNLFA